MTAVFVGLKQYAVSDTAIWQAAQDQANRNGSPVEIWTRDGWLIISEDPEPDGADESGWRSLCLVNPTMDREGVQ